MIYAELGDASELECLDVAISKAKKPQWYRRLLIIKLSVTEHLSVPKLAKMFNLSDDSVRSYIHKYNTSGLEALMPKSPPGCRGKITHFRKSDWDRLFEQTPDQYEKLNTDSRHWTLELISVLSQGVSRDFSHTACDPYRFTADGVSQGSEQTPCRESGSRISSQTQSTDGNLPLCENGTIDERGDSVNCPGSPTSAVRSPAP